MATPVSDSALDTLFRNARTYPGWLPGEVPLPLLQQLYELASLGPTSVNASPARFVFLTTPAAKARLMPALSPGNVDKTHSAPVTVIAAYDTEFYEQLPILFPHGAMRDMFAGNPALAHETAVRNGDLEAGYFLLAARALGLDCGPMSGFDNVKVDAEFFPDGKWKSNFLCNLGHGDPAKLRPRAPRLAFDQACRVL